MNVLKITFATLLMLVAAGCATLGKPLPPAPTTAEIVQLAKQGVPASEIIKRMEESRAVYRLPASELAKLREQGVPDKVIDYMHQTHLADERWREYVRAREMYFSFGWPYYRAYPHWPPGPYWR